MKWELCKYARFVFHGGLIFIGQKVIIFFIFVVIWKGTSEHLWNLKKVTDLGFYSKWASLVINVSVLFCRDSSFQKNTWDCYLPKTAAITSCSVSCLLILNQSQVSFDSNCSDERCLKLTRTCGETRGSWKGWWTEERGGGALLKGDEQRREGVLDG